jgi:hypothetical protein
MFAGWNSGADMHLLRFVAEKAAYQVSEYWWFGWVGGGVYWHSLTSKVAENMEHDATACELIDTA